MKVEILHSSVARRICLLFVLISYALIASGCVSTSIEDLGVGVAPPETGPYPDVTTLPKTAGEQVSDSEAEKLTRELQQAGSNAQRNASSLSTAEYERRANALKRKGQTHGAEALRKIEN